MSSIRTVTAPLAQMLADATRERHERLDARVMGLRAFDDADRYGRFLAAQYLFQRDIEALYRDPALGGLVGGLPSRSRLTQVETDLADLGLARPTTDGKPVFNGTAPTDPAIGIGWLYVAEGSTLGAGVLLKLVARLGYDESVGARHMAALPGGRGPAWHRFRDSINAVDLRGSGSMMASNAAQAAFDRFAAHLDASFA